MRKTAASRWAGCSARCPGTCLPELAKTGRPWPPGRMMAVRAGPEGSPPAGGTVKVMEGLRSAQVLALGAVMVSQAVGRLAVRAAVQETAGAIRQARAAASQAQAWGQRPCQRDPSQGLKAA